MKNKTFKTTNSNVTIIRGSAHSGKTTELLKQTLEHKLQPMVFISCEEELYRLNTLWELFIGKDISECEATFVKVTTRDDLVDVLNNISEDTVIFIDSLELLFEGRNELNTYINNLTNKIYLTRNSTVAEKLRDFNLTIVDGKVVECSTCK